MPVTMELPIKHLFEILIFYFITIDQHIYKIISKETKVENVHFLLLLS